MYSATLFSIIVTLNLVMIEQDRHKVNLPAQLYYDDQSMNLNLILLDTTEIYKIERITKDRASIIIKVYSDDCAGFLKVDLLHDYEESTRFRKIRGSVWFYKTCNHRYVDRRFSINAEACYALLQKHRKKEKTP